MSHKDFSRLKRTVKYIPGNQHFWVYGHWTWDYLQWNLLKNLRICPFIPIYVTSAMCRTHVNIGRLKNDFGSCIFPISFNAQTQVVSVTYENYSPVDLLIVNYIVSGLIFVPGQVGNVIIRLFFLEILVCFLVWVYSQFFKVWITTSGLRGSEHSLFFF